MNVIRLEEIMKEKNIGVTELASIMGVNRQTIYYYIKQDDKNSISQLQKIADALKVTLSDLISHEEPANSITCPNCGKRFVMEDSHIRDHKNIRGKEYYK